MACLTQAIVDLQRQYPRFPGRATEMYAYTDYSHFARWAGTPWMKRGDDYLAPKAVIRQRLLDELFRHVPAAKHIEKRASAKVGRCFRRLHAHGLIAIGRVLAQLHVAVELAGDLVVGLFDGVAAQRQGGEC